MFPTAGSYDGQQLKEDVQHLSQEISELRNASNTLIGTLTRQGYAWHCNRNPQNYSLFVLTLLLEVGGGACGL